MTMDINPTAAGLGGAAVILIFQYVWGRVVGSSTEKSIPVQLAEINVKLASIDAKLELAKQESEFRKQAFEELKNDFWRHMDSQHGWKVSSGPHTSYKRDTHNT